MILHALHYKPLRGGRGLTPLNRSACVSYILCLAFWRQLFWFFFSFLKYTKVFRRLKVMEVSFAFDMAGSFLSFQPRLKSHYFKSGLHWSSFLSLPNSSLALVRTSLYFLHTIKTTDLSVYMLLVLAQKPHVSKDLSYFCNITRNAVSSLSPLLLLFSPLISPSLHRPPTHTNAHLHKCTAIFFLLSIWNKALSSVHKTSLNILPLF